MSDTSTVARDFWPKLKKTMSYLPFAGDAVAAYYCAFDQATPLKVKGTLLAALAYFILPFDVVPDFILGLGFTDDMAVLFTAVGLVRNHITQDHRDRARQTLDKLQAETV